MTREEQLACLKDRPCDVCKMRTDKGCSSWECVFEQTPDEEKEPCDCISRQAVLDLIADYDLSMGQVVKSIHALPPVTPKPKTKWVPVSERLPKEGEKVLCWTTYNAFEVGYRDNEWGQDVWTTGEFASGTFRVVAWMPLPKPYTAEKE